MFDLPNRRGAEEILYFLFSRLHPVMCKEEFRWELRIKMQRNPESFKYLQYIKDSPPIHHLCQLMYVNRLCIWLAGWLAVCLSIHPYIKPLLEHQNPNNFHYNCFKFYIEVYSVQLSCSFPKEIHHNFINKSHVYEYIHVTILG